MLRRPEKVADLDGFAMANERLAAEIAASSTKPIKMPLRWLFDYLQRPKVVRWQILAYLNIFSAYKRVEGHYEITLDRFAASNNLRASNANDQNKINHRLQRRPLPRLTRLFDYFRVLTTVYMVYICAKFNVSKQIELLARQFVELDRPIHCYLAGRFVLEEQVAETTACFFSSSFLFWRLTRAIQQPFRMDLAYFLVQDEAELSAVHSKFESAHSKLSLSQRAFDQLEPMERFWLNLMCNCTVRGRRLVFRVRANRTREAYAKLRNCLARATLSSLAVIVPMALVLLSTFTILHALDQRYLSVYPNCDPQVELLQREGQLDGWSITWSRHHFLVMLADHFENLVMWLECGLTATLAPAAVYLVSYDLVLQWRGVERAMQQLGTSMQLDQDNNNQLVHSQRFHYGRARATRRRLRQLTVEMSDFFAQVRHVDEFQSQFLNLGLLGWLGLCASYTYNQRRQSLEQLPTSVIFVLLACALSISLSFYSSLLVHRTSSRSCRRLCSLMARYRGDPEKVSFVALLEFYTKQCDCFTIALLYPFRETTFLTVVGWTFSLVCLSAEVLRKMPTNKQVGLYWT